MAYSLCIQYENDYHIKFLYEKVIIQFNINSPFINSIFPFYSNVYQNH